MPRARAQPAAPPLTVVAVCSGANTDFNRLRILIETNGTIAPRQALESSIETMIHQLRAVIGFQEAEAVAEAEAEAEVTEGPRLISGGGGLSVGGGGGGGLGEGASGEGGEASGTALMQGLNSKQEVVV